MSDKGLTEEQLKKFREDGLLVVENFLAQDEVNSLRDSCSRLVEKMDPEVHRGVFSADGSSACVYFLESNDKIRYFFDSDAFDDTGKLRMAKGECLNKIGHALHYLDPDFKRVSFSDKVKAVARSLNLEDPVVIQGMYIFKNPHVGGLVTPHQDGTFLRNDPLKLIGFWFPIDDATEENGCLRYVPGSHDIPVTRHMVRNPMFNVDKDEKMVIVEGDEYPDFPDDRWVAAPCKRGSLVLIHGQVFHKSAANTSSKPRHAYTFHVIETKNCSYRKTNWLQPSSTMPFPKLYNFF